MTKSTVVKLLVGVVVLAGVVVFLIRTSGHGAVAAQAADCTRVMGFSQTDQWYEGGSFESYVTGDDWELYWHEGGRIDEWSRSSAIWSTGILFSACAHRPPDRVVFNVAPRKDQQADLTSMVADLTKVVAMIHQELPSVTTIVLQPLVGGPAEGICHDASGAVVNASYIHPFAEEAIAQVVDGSGILQGPDPHVGNCDMFADSTGHLTAAGSDYVARVEGAYWSTASP